MIGYWLIHSLILSFCTFLLYKTVQKDIPAGIFFFSVVLKLSAGIAVGLIYKYVYSSADTFRLFEEAEKISEFSIEEYVRHLFSITSYESTNQPRNAFFAKILSVLLLVNGKSYWISALYLSFFSYLSSALLAVELIRSKILSPTIIYCSLFFIPSVIFWSSGLLKDSVAHAAIYLLLASYFHLLRTQKFSWGTLILLLFSAWLLVKIKHYVFVTVVLFIGLSLIIHILTRFRSKLKWWIVIGVFSSIVVLSQLTHPYFRVDRILTTIYHNNQTIHESVINGSTMDLRLTNPSLGELVNNIPIAIHAMLFRPSITDSIPIWGSWYYIESFMIGVFIILSLLLVKQVKYRFDTRLVLPAIASILLLGVVLALSTPNLGTLVRYKSIYTPFLFMIIGSLPYQYFAFRSLKE